MTFEFDDRPSGSNGDMSKPMTNPEQIRQGVTIGGVVEVPAAENEQQAKSQAEKIRNARRNLNLDDDVEVS